MLIVPIEEAEPGMKLATNVAHPQNPEQVLLKAGFVLDAAVVKRLCALGILEICVDYPGFEDLDRYLCPGLTAARQGIYDQIKSSITVVQKTAQPTAGFSAYYQTTRELIKTLLEQGQHPLYMELMAGRLGADAVAHATSVAQLAVTLGIRLETYLIRQRSRLAPQHAKEVVNLGVAAMLHDLGKAQLPPELHTTNALESPEEESHREQWESHPRLGYELIRSGVEATAAAAVLHHHQHFDGSGFPTKHGTSDAPLKGERIHVFARILLVANLFDRIAGGEKGRRLPNYQVLHDLRSRYAGWVDPHILEILPSVVPPFPPGLKVILSDGLPAVVTHPNPKRPYRPQARRVTETGHAGDAVDLSAPGSPCIEKANGLSVNELVPAPDGTRGAGTEPEPGCSTPAETAAQR